MTIKKFNEYINESYGSNKYVEELTKFIIEIINNNLGKLIYNKFIRIDGFLDKFAGKINFKNSMLELRFTNKEYAFMKPNEIKIENDTIENVFMVIELTLSKDELTLIKLINNKINNYIAHELLHIMEIYYSNDNLSASWKQGEQLQKMKKKYNDQSNWLDIEYIFYLSLPHEIRARIQVIREDVINSGITELSDIRRYIESTKIFKDAQLLSNIKGEVILEMLKRDIKHKEILADFCNIFKLPSDENNLLNYIKIINNRGRNMVKKLLKVSYLSEDIMEETNKIFNI